MKTIEQWAEELRRAQQDDLRVEFLLSAIRREAFERCELEARRADSGAGGTDPQWPGKHIAEKIAKVFKEEGQK